MFGRFTRSLFKTHTLVLSASRMASSASTQKYDYFLVLDFEATCDKERKIHPIEIIEFPVLKINARTLECDATFHTYVTPTANPQLTAFCTELTGITQEMVTNQPVLADVLPRFHAWLEKEKLLENQTQFIFVTCGDWDLYTMLPSQCSHFHLPRADYFNHWINIKKSFHKATGKFCNGGMMAMLKELNIPHTGRHHSGIDDCTNIAEVLKGLIQRGYVFQENRKK